MITFILVVIAGVLMSVSDTLLFHYHSSVFKRLNPWFWNPVISWKNKYKNQSILDGERFPGSTTIFVFVTDAWHLTKFLWLGCLIAAIVTYTAIINLWVDFIILHVAFTGTFELCFRLWKKLR